MIPTHAADELTAALRAGHDLPIIETELLLDGGEVAHVVAATVSCWWYGEMETSYAHRQVTSFGGLGTLALTAGILALGNNRRRASAQRLAAPQWRSLGNAPVTVTSDRHDNGGRRCVDVLVA